MLKYNRGYEKFNVNTAYNYYLIPTALNHIALKIPFKEGNQCNELSPIGAEKR